MRTGDLVPDFTLPDQDGVNVSLWALLANGPVVLFFYPAAMTTGCTRETCHFRDLAREFNELGAQRVGISLDGVERQHEFAARNDLDFPLLADARGEVAASFGVKRSLDLLKVRRTTFVIDTDRRVLAAIHHELNMNAHADRALAVLRDRGSAH
ncbi:MAG TPA: peroxiredoxin [Acidimicrobiales bacterium]|nr:peroxiredoxin [Acidimicrobiales bacterium]